MNHRLILLLIVITSCSDSREYKIKFDRVERLEVGDKIFMRGVYVGEVMDLTGDKDEQAQVTISITNDINRLTGQNSFCNQISLDSNM